MVFQTEKRNSLRTETRGGDGGYTFSEYDDVTVINDADTDSAGNTFWRSPLYAGSASVSAMKVLVNGDYLTTVFAQLRVLNEKC